MKKLFIAVTALGLLFMVNSQAAKAQGEPEEAATKQEAAKAQDVGNKICPVSGEKIDEKTKATYEYEGKIYNFCCPMCIEEFKKDPGKYIKKVEEELKGAAPTAHDAGMPMDTASGQHH